MAEDEIAAANERLLRRRAELGVDGTKRDGEMRPAAETAAALAAKIATLPLPEADACGCERRLFAGRWATVHCAEHERQRREEEAKARAEALRRDREENSAAHLRRAGFMREHAGARLEHFPREVQDLARDWIRASRERWPGLLVKGPTGPGKTHLAAAVAREMVIGGLTVAAYLAGDLFALIRQSFRDGASKSELALLGELRGDLPGVAEALVIDDLGHEGTVTPFVVSALHRIISWRNGEYRPTIVTTNLRLEEIAQVYGEPIASRIGAWKQLVVDGEDRRARR